ncbi:M56 family metallopeptidase [Actinopolyspora mortivallis]|uniref:M56 family metallopeptidase n=1 Tax=Actinopolyspora mortivallis TaxID=33906 RepID=UPI00037DE806|nr:M56 family metallopeptidase [Actinopolyspora mortivallis]
MTLALGLLAAALLVAVTGPHYLDKTLSPRIPPGLALTAWTVSTLFVVAAACGGAVLLGIPHNESVDGLVGMANTCINTGRYLEQTIVRVTGIGVVACAGLRVLVVAVRRSRQHTARRDEHLSLLRFLGIREATDPRVFWLPENTPVAYSMGGRRGTVVATTGVTGLDPPAREAILAHERAHLRGRHHELVALAEVLAWALPFVPLFRAAPTAVRVSVELAADTAAVRVCGKEGLRRALCAVESHTTPRESLAMSREAVELRLRWLDPARQPPGNTLRRRAEYLVASFASLLPGLTGVVLFSGCALVGCLALRTFG